MSSLLSLREIRAGYGEREVVRGASLTVEAGEFCALLGLNGCGKTTLLRILTGVMDYDEGDVVLAPGKRLGLISQIPVYPAGYTVEDVLATAFESLHRMEGEMAQLATEMAQGNTDPAVMSRYDKLTAAFEAAGGYDTQTKTNKVCNGLSIPQAMREQLFDKLSGGEKTRVNLGRLILEDTDILLLDEPTNDLDVTTLSILEDYLQGFPGPILVVSHDRFLLDKLAESIFEVRDGQVLRYTGNWSDWQAKRREEEAPAKAEKPKAAAERPRERKLKFSYKEQLEFETIDGELAELERQVAECAEAQGRCGSDYVKLQELQAKQAELEAKLEEKTERWVYLTELKEKIDAQNG